MKESLAFVEDKEIVDEFQEKFFEFLEKNTKVFNNEEYQKIYSLHKAHWGINSPACILPRGLFSKHPYSELISSDIEGDLIAINAESVSNPIFTEYLKEHEYSELYIKRKAEDNLSEETKKDFLLPILERKRPSHRYATRKEFEMADQDGKLDEYMQWWRDFYQKDIEEVQNLSEKEIERISKNYGEKSGNREMIIQFIKNNLALKENIYKEIK